MTPQEFTRRWNAKKAKLLQYVGRPAHVKMGNTAVSWFRKNYQAERWFNGSTWENWKKPKRFNGNGTTSERYGTLMSKRAHLFRNIKYDADENRAVISNNVVYAKAHNEGDEFDQTITITPKMRKWAWAMYYKSIGGKRGGRRGKKGGAKLMAANPVADKYKALALTKKESIRRHVIIPKRPFIYNNAELAKVLRLMLKEDIRKIMEF